MQKCLLFFLFFPAFSLAPCFSLDMSAYRAIIISKLIPGVCFQILSIVFRGKKGCAQHFVARKTIRNFVLLIFSSWLKMSTQSNECSMIQLAERWLVELIHMSVSTIPLKLPSWFADKKIEKGNLNLLQAQRSM